MQILHLDQRIIMASRTDAGVHALDQVFHFDINEKLDCFRLKGSFNYSFDVWPETFFCV